MFRRLTQVDTMAQDTVQDAAWCDGHTRRNQIACL